MKKIAAVLSHYPKTLGFFVAVVSCWAVKFGQVPKDFHWFAFMLVGFMAILESIVFYLDIRFKPSEKQKE